MDRGSTKVTVRNDSHAGRRRARAWVAGLLLAASAAVHAQVERVSVTASDGQSNADSYRAAVSDDGQVVAFQSNADNLVAGDANDWTDVFVRDLATGTTERVSLQPDGSETASYSKHASLSDDGNLVVFEGRNPASGITVSALTDRAGGTTVHLLPRSVSGGNPGSPRIARLQPVLSGNGAFVAFRSRATFQDAWPEIVRPPGDDGNSAFDVFVMDIHSAPTPPLERVSRLTGGDELDADSRSPVLSDDGRFAAFETYSDLLSIDTNNRADIMLKDRGNGVLALISTTPGGAAGNGSSLQPAMSGDASAVAFRSEASDLVPGDTNGRWDIFIRDHALATTTRVSVAFDGGEANHNSAEPSVSDDARFVAFRSMASNLVADDTNARADIFVHDRDTGETAIVSRPPGGQSDGHSANPAISGDGAWIVFESDATNLVVGDNNGARDIFRAANPLATTGREGR